MRGGAITHTRARWQAGGAGLPTTRAAAAGVEQRETMIQERQCSHATVRTKEVYSKGASNLLRGHRTATIVAVGTNYG